MKLPGKKKQEKIKKEANEILETFYKDDPEKLERMKKQLEETMEKIDGEKKK